MARAHVGTGFFLVVGFVVSAATAAAQTPSVAPSGPPPTLPVSNPHEALNDAIEAQRRGEYENGALYLQVAAAKQALLTTTEQQELTRLLKDNLAALDARHAAAEQLRLAVQALNDTPDRGRRFAQKGRGQRTVSHHGRPPDVPPVQQRPQPARRRPGRPPWTPRRKPARWSARPATSWSWAISTRPSRGRGTPPPSRSSSPRMRIRRSSSSTI